MIIQTSKIQFRNPQTGQPTRAVEEHYNGRTITALVGGEVQLFRLTKDEIAFDVTEEEMIAVLEKRSD